MILLVNGCSHAAGSEIEPLEAQPRGWSPDKAFGSHLARELGFGSCTNIALPGGSNERILRTTIEFIGAEPQPDVFVFVLWTGPLRFEFYDEKQRYWYNICPGIERTIFYDKLSYVAQRYFKYHMLLRTGAVECETRRWVEVILLQHYLKSRGIPFFFANAYDHLVATDAHRAYVPQLDTERFYQPFSADDTFHRWLSLQGYRVQPALFSESNFRGFQGHYGEDGQRAWARRMAQVIRERGLV